MDIRDSNLGEIYSKFLEKYEKSFGYSPKIIYKQILISKNEDEIASFSANAGFLFNQELEIIRFHEHFQDIYGDLLEFCAILSYIPLVFLENKNIFIFLFLLNFNKNKNREIIKWYVEYIGKAESEFEKIMYSFSPFVAKFFKKASITQIMRYFIPYLKQNISNREFIQSISQYFLTSDLENMDLNLIRNIIYDDFSFLEFFSRRKYQRSTTKPEEDLNHIFSIFVRNFPKISLKPYYFIIILKKETPRNNKILSHFFQTVTFFGYFNRNNHVFSFYCYVPEKIIGIITAYLHILQKHEYFHEYYYYQYEYNKHFIQFDSKLPSSLNLSSIFPFNSKKYFEKINGKKDSVLGENITIVCEDYDFNKEMNQIDKNKLDSLTLFLFFNSPEIFHSFKGHKSKKKFLLSIKKKIFNSKYPRLLKKYPNIDEIEKQHKKFQDNGIFSEYDSLNQMKRNIHNYDKLGKRSLKFCEFLRDFNLHNPKAFTDDNFRNLCFLPYENVKHFFQDKKCYNEEAIQERVHILFKNNMISQSKVKQVGSLLNSQRMNIFLNIQANYNLAWLEKILFHYYHGKFSGFNTKTKFLHNYYFYVDYSNYSLFMQYLLKEKLQIAQFFYNTLVEDIEDSLLLFKPYTNNLWNSNSFKLDYFVEKAIKNKEKYQSAGQLTPFVFSLKNRINYKFRFKTFYTSLSLFNKLNIISRSIKNKRSLCNILFKTYITTRFFKSSFLKPLQKESFTINIEHYKVFEETILNAVSTPIPASGNKNIIIYLEQANSDLNPFLLIHDPLIRGLFSINIINAWFFGGRQNPILILQYLIPEVFYFTKTSEWNRLLTNLTGKYPSLKLHLFEVTKERRFYNEQSIFSLNPRHLEYLTLTFPKKIDENYSNPYELVYNFEEQQLSLDSDGINKKFQENRSLTESEMEILCRKKVIYTPTYFSWQFFQLIQYPVLVFIKIHSVPEVKYQRLIALFEQLPIGHIFEITNLENGDKDLSVFLQLRDNIPRFFQRMIGILDLQKLAYYITPVLTLDLYQDSAFAKILAISRKKFKFRTARGELLEIPIFLWHQRHSTYSPQDQITIYESLYEIYPKIKAQLTHQNWKSILKRISELYNTEDFTEQGIIREISGLFSIE